MDSNEKNKQTKWKQTQIQTNCQREGVLGTLGEIGEGIKKKKKLRHRQQYGDYQREREVEEGRKR